MPRLPIALVLGVVSFCAPAEPTQDELLAFQIRMSLVEIHQKAIVAPAILPSCTSRSASADRMLTDESCLPRWVMRSTHALMRAWPLDADSGRAMERQLQSLMNEAREAQQLESMRGEVAQMSPQRVAELCEEMEALAVRVEQASSDLGVQSLRLVPPGYWRWTDINNADQSKHRSTEIHRIAPDAEKEPADKRAY